MVPFVSVCFVLRITDEGYAIVKLLSVGNIGFCRMKQLGVFLPRPPPLDGMLGQYRVPHSIKFTGTHLYTSEVNETSTTAPVYDSVMLPCQWLLDVLCDI